MGDLTRAYLQEQGYDPGEAEEISAVIGVMLEMRREISDAVIRAFKGGDCVMVDGNLVVVAEGGLREKIEGYIDAERSHAEWMGYSEE